MTKQEEFEIAISNNDIKKVKYLLNNKSVNPADKKNIAILIASDQQNKQIIELLVQDKRVDPSVELNFAFFRAYKKRNFYIMELLLKDKRVSHQLKRKHIKLYNEITKLFITKKISEF